MTPEAKLEAALPRSFEFYHLGQITLSPAYELPEGAQNPTLSAEWPTESDDRVAIAYSLQGETRGALILLVEPELDVSTYSEAGNIIASRLASTLAASGEFEVSISPPRILSASTLKNLLKSGSTTGTARTYLHRHGERTVRLTALVLPASPSASETGNA